MSFVEDFKKLQLSQPRIALVASDSENSDYTNYAYKNKNCYLVFGGHYNEDTFYGQYTWRDTDCVDCDKVGESELCYECTFGSNLYNCDFLYNCFSSSDCEFGYDLVNCRNCFLCAGLRNAEYFIKNKQVSKDEYKNAVKKLKSEKSAQKSLDELSELRHTIPHVNLLQKNCENCMGTFLENSKNCFYTFNATNAEDSMYMATNNDAVKDSMDCDCIGYDPSELLYECIGNSGNNNCNFCYACWHNSDLEYCEQVFNSKHCFGCISRSHAEYEILNKKYKKEEWFKRVAEIKAELKSENLYGKWLLPSSYPYEDTIAPLYFE